MQLGAVMSAAGYSRLERIAPPGVPLPTHQVVYRFRPTNPNDQSRLFQVGHSIFTANALPPYQSWAEFSPLVEKGIDSLLIAYKRANAKPPSFTTALVRYINAFDSRFTKGLSTLEFLRQVLGVHVTLPGGIEHRAVAKDQIQPAIQFTVPIADGQMQISLGDGQKGNERAVIMDILVVLQRPMGTDVGMAMQALADARLVIHETFREITRPLHEFMEPVE